MNCGLYVLILVVEVAALLIGNVQGRCEWTTDQSVVCNLKILDFRRNSSSAAMQVPDPGLDEASSLRIACSDVFFFESQLRSDHFGSLSKLSELEISFCKLRTLPPSLFVGLGTLTSLVIHTHNKDWTSLQMEPDYEALVGLERLQSLDMRQNNLHKLPSGFFCPLKNVGHVDMSFNAIADLNLLGLSHTKEELHCSIPVHTLMMNNNGLRTVTPGALGALPALKHIDLSHNEVGVLVDATFEEMSHLETLDLSFNRLAAIPPNIFRHTPNLKTLVLSNNTLGTIDINAFSNLTSLQTLNMSGNNLDENWIRPGIFSGLHNLVVLDLSGNHIARLDQGLLDDLTTLQVLNLGHNKIHTIASHSFLSLANLYSLVLSHNQLETMQRQTLTGLSLLNSLDLDHNRLHTMHSASLRNCTALASLGLSHNFLTQVPTAAHHSLGLQFLDLSSNRLGVLNRESLQGLPKLKTLRLGDNELSRLGEGAFVEVPGLEELDLSSNRFMALEQETFKDVIGLRKLDLSDNKLENVNGLFTNQISLVWLNLSVNHLSWFDYAFVPPSLELLDIHFNNIDSLGNYYALRDNYALKYVDASVNNISSVQVLSILPGIIEIDLSNNSISRIAPNTFLGKHSLTKVHLERNRLETMAMSSLMVTLAPNNRKCNIYSPAQP
jgi:Leucine-rich repeat (LRR) protein